MKGLTMIKTTVLVDNNTLIDKYLVGEPAFSVFIECDGKKILFDAGYSDVFMMNAEALGIDLFNIDHVGLSHGHLDHILGLKFLTKAIADRGEMKTGDERPMLVTHPFTLSRQSYQNPGETADLLSESGLSKYFRVITSRNPVWITDHLIFLGEIDRTNDFEATKPFGKINKDGIERDDFIVEDSALVYRSPDGLVIITGCSHSGICNIVEYAQKICRDDRIIDIIGGFHLREESEPRLQRTTDCLKKINPQAIHACHCTDLTAKIALAGALNIKEVGVGLVLEYS